MQLAAPSRAAHARPSLAAAVAVLWITAATLLASVCLLVIVRRLAGALAVALSPLGMAAAGVAAAALTAAVRIGWRLHYREPTPAMATWQVEAVASACLMAFAFALSMPDSTGTGLALLWGTIVVEEALAWNSLSRRRRSVRPVPTGGGSPAVDSSANDPCDTSSVDELDAPPDAAVLQQLARRVSADGAEEINGWLRLPLQVGQQSGSLHVAFCPPLAAPPEVELEQADGPPARIKIALTQPYGARLDVKLASPAAETTSLLVQFFARVARSATSD